MRLPVVLEPPLFAPAELAALRLDGDVFDLGDATVAADQPVDAAVRAACIAAAAWRHGLVGERRTAAWVHGAAPVPPRPHALCVAVLTASRSSGGLREVRFAAGELVALGGMQVTAPLRTAWDLARLEPDWDAESQRVARALLALAGCTPTEGADRLRAAVRSPHKRRGVARLEALAEAGQPADTR